MITNKYKHLSRYKEIISAFIEFGFESIITDARLDNVFTKKIRARFLPDIQNKTTWERIRLLIGRLGPSFIKLGQILSNRPDILPSDLIHELTRLQDRVPAFSNKTAYNIIQKSLGYPVKSIFSYISAKPIAAASIAQVYKARIYLYDGKPIFANDYEIKKFVKKKKSSKLKEIDVAVKVRRPNIEEIIRIDIEILLFIASILEKRIAVFKDIELTEIIYHLRQSITQELNFITEASNIKRFKKKFSSESSILAPEVFDIFSSSSVLTMEFIHGKKLSLVINSKQGSYDKKSIAIDGASAVFTQIFEHGFFHADPHSGNIIITKDNKICFIDFGMMGYLTEKQREFLIDILIGITQNDAERIVQRLKLSSVKEIQEEKLEYDISLLLNEYTHIPVKYINLSDFIPKVIDILVSYRIRIDPVYYVLSKALITIEGIATALDPDYDIIENISPYVVRVVAKKLSPLELLKKFYSYSISIPELLKNLPFEIITMIKKFNKGDLRITLELKGLDRIIKELDIISNRLSSSLIISSLIIGSSFVLRSNLPPIWYGFSVIGLLGFFVSAIMGLLLLLSIIKKH